MENYELIKIEGTYHQVPGCKPTITKAFSYYLSLIEEQFNYKGVKVYIKKQLNLDGSLMGYKIIKTSLPYSPKNLHFTEVRGYIDKKFNELDILLNKYTPVVSYKLRPNKDIFYHCQQISWCPTKTGLEKRYILKELIKKGLPKAEVLKYIKNI